MNTAKIRERSTAEAGRLGYGSSFDLPLLEPNVLLRSQGEVVSRCLALFSAVAVAFGFPRERARAWTTSEGLADALAPSEQAFLQDDDDQGLGDDFTAAVEALWALVWSLGMTSAMDFGVTCADNLIGLFPNLKACEPSQSFADGARLRSVDDILQAVDLSYCLHWSIVQAHLDRRQIPGRVPAFVVIQRRHALEWLISRDDWDEISLDT